MANPLVLIIRTFQEELAEKHNITVNVWSGNGKGKALGGAKALLESCGGDLEMACEVVRVWLSSRWERQHACHLYRCAQVAPEHMIAIQERRNQQPTYVWDRVEQQRVGGWEDRNVPCGTPVP